jgi:hypothetical protein
MRSLIVDALTQVAVAATILDARGVRDQTRLHLAMQHYDKDLAPLLARLGLLQLLKPIPGYGAYCGDEKMTELEYRQALDVLREELRIFERALDTPSIE